MSQALGSIEKEQGGVYRLMNVDLSRPLPPAVSRSDTGPYNGIEGGFQFTVMLHSRPIGVVRITTRDTELSSDKMANDIWRALSSEINDHLRADGLAPVEGLNSDGIVAWNSIPVCRKTREEFLYRATMASIVLCTRDRPEVLDRCLSSLVGLNYPEYEIIVVDNAPSSDLSRDLVQRKYGKVQNIVYVREEIAGLSQARNCGLRHARGEIVVYTDDDVLADQDWLAALAEGFEAGDRVAAVSGLLLPYKLETAEQVLFEDSAGLGKGFRRKIYDLKENRPSDPTYPFSAGRFGSGANMAFRSDLLRRLGGFDVALGSGTITRGGEDLAIFFDIIRAGYQVVYEPSAVIYHDHQCKNMDALRRQVFGYGSGLTAYLMKCVMDDPRTLIDLARKMPAGLDYALSPGSKKNRGKGSRYPGELTRLELKGMLYGLLAYPLSRWRHRKERAMASHLTLTEG